jgi:hypothetical protein
VCLYDGVSHDIIVMHIHLRVTTTEHRRLAMKTLPILLLSLASACAPSATPGSSTEVTPDPTEGGTTQPPGGGGGGGGGGDIDSGTDTDTNSDTDTDTNTDTDTGSTPPPPPPSPIHFVVLGDAGTGDDNQRAVANGMTQVCAANGCDFALYVGDNFYSDGVSSIDDSQFQDKFEVPYAALNFPFHAVAGNHDYGGGGGGYDAWRTDLEVEYTSHSTKWSMPDQFYTFTEGDSTFIGLDTTALDWGNTAEQAAWIPGAVADATTTWKFAFGHHPYLSNGSHGNANSNFAPFVEANLCGQIDVYFSGHDHDLEWLESTCPGTEFIVSGGGGAGTYSLNGNDPAYFASETHGFLWVEVDGRNLTGVFYDQDGVELFRKTITK